MSSELLTTAETAAVLKKSIRTIARKAERGELPYVRKLAGKNGYLFDSVVVHYAARLEAEKAS